MSEAAGHQAALYGRRVAAMNERTVEEHPPRLIAAADANPYAVPSERYLQTAFLSAAGRWGMIVSDEEHAVVGGTAAFIEALVESYPAVVPPRLVGQDGWYASENAVAPEDQVIEFIRAAPEWSNDLSRWLPKHLAHVYGPAAVDTLLARAGVV